MCKVTGDTDNDYSQVPPLNKGPLENWLKIIFPNKIKKSLTKENLEFLSSFKKMYNKFQNCFPKFI